MSRSITLNEIKDALNLEVLSGQDLLDREVQGGYVSDLLSDVIARAKKGFVWVTLQCHPNVIAVAVLKQLAGIVIVNRKKPQSDTLNKAEKEKIPVLYCTDSAFEVVGRLSDLGVSG